MKPFLALLALLWTVPAAALTPYLVKDINLETVPGSSSPASFKTLGNVALFEASDGKHGRELWRSDGTAAGTFLLADACEGDCFDEEIVYLAVTATRAWYFAPDVAGGLTNLWVTDGTRAGTLKLGPANAFVPFRSVAEAGGILYFATQTELWRSDGTPAGTGPVAEFPPAFDLNVRELTAVGNIVFFSADDGNGRSLWKSDGTPAGTVEVEDVEPRVLRALGGRLYFWATDETRGTELWRSDGTPEGTVPVAGFPDVITGEGTAPAQVFDAAVHGSRLYFIADTAAQGQELWVTDGTASGTRVLTNLEVPKAFSDGEVVPFPRLFLPRESSGGRLAFLALGPQGAEVWVTDGTPGGTRSLRLVCPGPCEILGSPTIFQPVPFNGKWLFVAFDEARGFEPWITDGTVAGTRLVRDICAGDCSSNTYVFGQLGNRLILVAQDIRNGEQLWITDGTPRGTVRLTDIPDNGIFPFSSEGAFVNGSFLFPVYTRATGSELWISDGTRSGTGLLVDINTQNHGGSYPRGWMPAGDRVYFFANDGEHGDELWRSDGTAAGTRLVADLTPGLTSSLVPTGASAFARGKVFFAWAPVGEPLGFWRTDGSAAGTFRLTPAGVVVNSGIAPVAVGKEVFFVARDAAGEELWRTDGRVTGTRRVADLEPGAAGSLPHELTAFRGRLFFVASAQGRGEELWRSDGTARGTALVKDINPGSDSFAHKLLVHADRLYFVADDGVHGHELWRSDGTAAGTVLVADLAPGDANTQVLWMTSAGSRLFLSLDSLLGGPGLWTSDGTAAGTRRFSSLEARGPSGVFFQGQVWFAAASDGVGGFWRSNGTEAGTRPVLDRDGQPVPSPFTMAVFAGHLLFTVSSPSGGELWQTNGTAKGTFPLRSIFDGQLAKTSNRVFFAAQDHDTGLELWAVRP